MNPHLGKWKYNAGEYKARSGQASSHWQGRCCVALVLCPSLSAQVPTIQYTDLYTDRILIYI